MIVRFTRTRDDIAQPGYAVLPFKKCCGEMSHSWSNHDIGVWSKGTWPNDDKEAETVELHVCLLMSQTMFDSAPYTVGRPIKKCPYCGANITIVEEGEIDYKEDENCDDCDIYDRMDEFCKGFREARGAGYKEGDECERWVSKTKNYVKWDDRDPPAQTVHKFFGGGSLENMLSSSGDYTEDG